MVQRAFVEFYKSEVLGEDRTKATSTQNEIHVTETVTGTGRRPILEPSIMELMPAFTTGCGKSLADINNSTLDRKEKLKLTQAIKARERRWIANKRKEQMPIDSNQEQRELLLQSFRRSLLEIPPIDDTESSSRLLQILESRVTKGKKLQDEIRSGIQMMEMRTGTRAKLQDEAFYLKQIHFLLDTLSILKGAACPPEHGTPYLTIAEAEEALREAGVAYVLVKGKTNQANFVEASEDIGRVVTTKILRPAVSDRQQILERARVERIQERYITLMGDEASSNPVTKNAEISSSLMTLLFPPRGLLPTTSPNNNQQVKWPLDGPVFPRLEQIYKVVITPNRASLASQVNVLGEKSACNAAVRFLLSNPTVMKVNINKDDIFAVIGTGGANKRMIEETIKAPLAVKESEVFVLGSGDVVERFKTTLKDVITEMQKERRNNAYTLKIPITRAHATYFQSRSSGSIALKSITRPLEVIPRVLHFRGDDTEQSELMLSGKNSAVEEAESKIKELISDLGAVSFKGPSRASYKLLAGMNALKTLQRLSEQLVNSSDLTNSPVGQRRPIDEFGDICRRNRLSALLIKDEIFYLAEGVLKPEFEIVPEVEMECELETDTEGILVIVGTAESIEEQKEALSSCFRQAAYLSETVEISLNQANVLTRDKLPTVVGDLPVLVRYGGRDRYDTHQDPKARIIINGTEADRAKAKDIIVEWCLENAVESSFELKTIEMRQKLMANGRSLLNYYQEVHNVHVSFTCAANSTAEGDNPLALRVVGSKQNAKNCEEEIIDKDQELWQILQECEVKAIKVPRSSVGAVIGIKGANLRNIEDVSGARVVQRRDQAAVDSDVVVFDVKGEASSIEVAINMIEGRSNSINLQGGASTNNSGRSSPGPKISRYEKLPFTPNILGVTPDLSRGRGRGRRVPATATPPPVTEQSFQNDFPDLGVAMMEQKKPKFVKSPEKKIIEEAVPTKNNETEIVEKSVDLDQTTTSTKESNELEELVIPQELPPSNIDTPQEDPPNAEEVVEDIAEVVENDVFEVDVVIENCDEKDTTSIEHEDRSLLNNNGDIEVNEGTVYVSPVVEEEVLSNEE